MYWLRWDNGNRTVFRLCVVRKEVGIVIKQILLCLCLLLGACPAIAQNPPMSPNQPPDPLRTALGNIARQYQLLNISSDNLAQAVEAYQHVVEEKLKTADAKIKELEKQIKELSPPTGK